MLQQITVALVLCLLGAQSQAALLGRSPVTPEGADYQAYYDDVLNITWMANANAGAGSIYDDGDSTIDGQMTWDSAQAWIASLNTENYLGVSDWRLPNVAPVNGSTFAYGQSYDGSTDESWNISAPGSAYPGSTGSEMAHLFYDTLGNSAGYNFAGEITPCGISENCLANIGPFSNLQPGDYWSGSEYLPIPGQAWGFNFSDGGQDPDPKVNSDVYAWAVVDGDIAAVIPLPAAVWLLGSALGFLTGVRRRALRN